jgi:hypothetical protein
MSLESDSLLGILYHVRVGNISKVSELYSDSTFRVEESKACDWSRKRQHGNPIKWKDYITTSQVQQPFKY